LDNYFKIDPEPHLIGDMSHIDHFPGVQMWWKAIENIKRPLLFGAPAKLLAPLYEGFEEWEIQKTPTRKACCGRWINTEWISPVCCRSHDG